MQRIGYQCPSCRELLDVPASGATLVTPCPHCREILRLPPTMPLQDEATVPVSLTLPRGLGGFQAKVSPHTANHMASTWLGGMLVVVGVVIAAMFGVNLRGRGA